jgi:triacylglycerol lipase
MINETYIALIIVVAFLIIAYFTFIVVYMFKYMYAVSYSTDNNIKCDNTHCTDEAIENYSYIPTQYDNNYSANVSKFCAQLILRLEYNHKYKTIYPELLTQTMSLQDKYKNPVFCVIFKDDSENAWIVLRGTYTFSEFVADIDYSQVSFKDDKMLVHRGFYKIYKNIRDELLKYLNINKSKIKKIFITGHSLGAAISTILAVDMYLAKYEHYVYCFGSPRVGNPDFCNFVNKNCNIYNIVNQADVVTNVPPSVCANFKNKKQLYYYNNSGKQILFDDNWFSLKNNHRMPVYIKNI